MGQFLICLCLSLEKHYWSKTNFMLIPWPSLLSSLGRPCRSEQELVCAQGERRSWTGCCGSHEQNGKPAGDQHCSDDVLAL